MATTTNLGLYKPTRDDYISVQRDLSNNYDLIDAAVGQNNILINDMDIVINGNTASVNVTAGQFVTVRNSTIAGITDGIYMAENNVASGTAFTSSNLQTVTGGALNSLIDRIGTVNSKTITQTLIGAGSSNAYFAHSSISDYDLIVVSLIDQTYGAIHGSAIVPKDTYMQSTISSAIGVSSYNNGRVYGYSNYINNNTSNAQVSAGYSVYLYGIRWN